MIVAGYEYMSIYFYQRQRKYIYPHWKILTEVPDPIWGEVKEPEARNLTDNIVKVQLGLVNWKLLDEEGWKDAGYEANTCCVAVNVSQ